MILCIDPGLYSMGVAFWREKAWTTFPCVPTWATLVKCKSNNTSWWTRAHFQAIELGRLTEMERVRKVYCEFPQLFSNSAASYAATAEGQTHKLAFLVGRLVGQYQLKGAEIILLSPGEWKGQLPKKVVENRCRRILGDAVQASWKADIWDAIGMGLAIQNAL